MTMKKLITTASAASVALLPALAAAAPLPGTGLVDSASGYVAIFISFVNGTLIPLLFALIFVYFAWGVYTALVKGADSADLKKEGQTRILNSIIGTVLILSFWGLVNFVAGGLGLGSGNINVPRVPGVSVTQPVSNING